MKKLSAEAHAYLNDASLIAERDMWFARLSDLFDGKENDYNAKRYSLFTASFPVQGTIPICTPIPRIG